MSIDTKCYAISLEDYNLRDYFTLIGICHEYCHRDVFTGRIYMEVTDDCEVHFLATEEGLYMISTLCTDIGLKIKII